MLKRVFIIHGWGGYPEEGWFPWLKSELEKRGFQVSVPAMPEADNPRIESWIPYLAKAVGEVDEQTFFVGHSIGCQTILRFLTNLPNGQAIGGAVFVAGWLTLQNLETDEEKAVAGPWLEAPLDFEKAKKHAKKFFAIFSDNDPYVPISNRELFEKKLGVQTLIEHDKGHFSGSDGVKELPSALKVILEF